VWFSLRALLLLASRSLAASRLRTSLTVLAVLLGVACIMGTLTAIAAIQSRLEQSAEEAAGRADLEVRALPERGFPLAAAGAARSIPGVTLVAPVVEKRTFLRAEGAPRARGFVHLVGLDWRVEAEVRSLTLRAGRWPEPGERAVALMNGWAAEHGLGLGAQVELITRDGFRVFDVVGLVGDAGLARRSFGRVVFVALEAAQDIFGMQDRVTHLSLRLERPELREEVARRLADVLPVGYTTLQPDEVGRELRSAAEQLALGLLLFGATALFVGAFLINNTINMTIAEQRRHIGLLRAAGVTREQVLVIVLVQALGVGLLGSAAGVLLGLGLAHAIMGSLSGWTPSGALAITWLPQAVAVSLGVGVLTAAGSALWPAWKASAIMPVEAIRQTRARLASRAVRVTRIAVPGLVIAGAVGLVWPVPEPVAAPLRTGSVLLFLLAAGLVAIELVAPLAAVCAAPFRWLIRAEGRLAELNLRRAQYRAGLTVVGFTASLALMLALATLGSSAATAGQQRLAGLFPGDVLLVSPVSQPARVLDAFRQEAEVSAVSPLRPFPVASGTTWLDAMAVEPVDYAQALPRLLTAGDPEAAARRLRAGRAVLIPSRLAQSRDLDLGDTLPLMTVHGPAPFVVVGILAASFPSSDQLGALVLSRWDAQRLFGVEGFRLLAVTPATGVSAADSAAALTPLAERYGMEVVPMDEVRSAIGEGVGRLLYLFSGLIGVGVLVAALGMVNTMMVNIAERRREIGVLRALGLTRGQVQAMVLAEAGMMGLMGGLLGVLSGLALGRLLVLLARSPDFDPQPILPLGAAVLGVLGAMLVAMLAALGPARAAARIGLGRPAME
jgi:putative ABC transport system permease protein